MNPDENAQQRGRRTNFTQSLSPNTIDIACGCAQELWLWNVGAFCAKINMNLDIKQNKHHTKPWNSRPFIFIISHENDAHSAAVLVRTENWPPRIRDGVVRHECHVPIRCGVHIFEKCNPLFALITCAVTWIWSNRGGKIASKDWDNKYKVTLFLHSCT